jgi:RNA polymerase sigma factor (sigma-70 family)
MDSPMEIHAQAQNMVVGNLGLARLVVRRFLARFGRIAEADDLMQEACLGLIRAARQYDPGRGVRFSTYAFRCCWRACVDAARCNRAWRPSHADDSLLEGVCAPDPPPDEQAAAVELWGRLQKLNPRERSLLRHRFEQGQAHAVLARHRGCSRDRIRRMEQSALAKVRGR